MPYFFRRFWPYLALACLAVIAAEPLTRAQFMCTDDAPFHLYRAVELGRLVAAGHWLPRWAPHMAQGYGYPFFNFYAPLSSYIVVGLHTAGLAYPLALRATFILGLWLAGASAYLFVRDLFGPRAGLAAAAAYLLAPYLAYDILYRGNLAESFAFIWPPLVLLALRRMKVEGGQRTAEPRSAQAFLYPSSLSLHPFFYAALILTHNVFALIASPLLAGYAVLRAWQTRSGRLLAWSLLGLAAGAALTAYFWLPALAERNLVHSDRLLVPPIFTWYTNFVSARELLAPLPAFDQRLINPSPARTIGLVTVLAGLPALLIVFSRRVRAALPAQAASTVLFFAAALLGYCTLTLEASAPLWRLIRPLELVQFPWRLLGPAALCAAVLVGASVAALEAWLADRARGPLAAVPAALAVGVVFLGAQPAWNAIYCPSPATATLGDLVRFEADSHTIGTTAKGEYLPRTVTRQPAETDLAQALQQGVEPVRLRLPAGAALLSAAAADPLDASFEIDAAAPVSAVYRQFLYPGWQVTVNGQPAALTPTPEEGLISFALPPGAHTVRVWFGSTPLRTAAGALSGLTLTTLMVALVADPLRRRPRLALASREKSAAAYGERDDGAPPRLDEGGDQQRTAAALLVLVCALAPVAKLTLIDRLPPPTYGGSPVAPQFPLQADLAGGVRLYGYELSSTTLPGDGFIDVAWYAALHTGSLRRWWPAVALEDAAGQAWSVLNPLPPRWHREPKDTPEWGPGNYAQWARHVTPLPGTPPGSYTLYGWVFDRDNLEIASVLDEAGNALAPRVALAQVTLTRPRRPYALQPLQPAVHDLGAIGLLGFELDRAEALAGDAVTLSLYWRSLAATGEDLTARVELLDAAGTPAFSAEVEPANGYPTSAWRPGDQWLGQHPLRLPAALPTGDYTLALSVVGPAPQRALLGTLRVFAPDRSFEPLPFVFPSGAAFGDVAVLEGLSLAREPGTLRVVLAWRAAGSPPVSYTAFVHLADATGRVWAQSDAVPAGWTRPTTGWVPGEYVRDEHTLFLPADLPAGDYTLWVGLYDPLTSQRLPATGPGAAADQRVAATVVAWP